MLLLGSCEDISFPKLLLVIFFSALLVDPVEEEGLVALEISLSDEHIPQLLNVLNADLNLILRLQDKELNQLQNLLQGFIVFLISHKSKFSHFLRQGLALVDHLLKLLLDSLVVLGAVLDQEVYDVHLFLQVVR